MLRRYFFRIFGARNRKFISSLVVIFIFILAAMTGCQSNKKDIRIGFSQCTGEDGWRRSQLEEMKRELAFHPNVTFIYKDAKESNKRQIQQIKELLEQDIDVLIVSPNEARPLTPIVNKVYKKGIPVIVVDRKTNSSLYTTYVGADNQKIGFLAGQYIAGLLHGNGKIVEIQGLAGSTPAIERHKGFIKALKVHPDIQIIKEIHADWTGPTASQKLEEAKTVAKDADLVFAQNDVMAHAAYQMYQLWDLQSGVKFIGVDASPGPDLGLSWVSQGILTASVLYPTGGKEAIRAAVKAAQGQQPDKTISLSTLVIDSTNVELMKLQTDKILSQQKDIERQQNLLDEQLKIYKSQKNILYILLGTLLIAILLGTLAYLSFRRNKRITQSLRSKNKEILFQQNKMIEFSNQAKEATEAKLNFFTNISHEFRTPLTLIFGAIEEITESKAYKNALKDHLVMIKRNANRLYRMVNQLIDYRKIDVNKMKLQASEKDMVSFLEDIVSSFKGLAQKRNIDLRFHTEEAPVLLWFDPYMLDKVFFNLLSNAFKFTEDYGKISLTLRYSKNKKTTIIEIDDNGSGISDEEAERIFEPFYQGKNNQSKGFGLGLPLAKEFIRLHHGNLAHISKESMGATFRITLLVGKDHLSPEEIQEQPFLSAVNNDQNNPDELSGSVLSADTSAQDQLTDTKNISVLIIEDNEELLQFLRKKLNKKFNVIIAEDGEKGLKKAFDTIPDLIVCDIVMPNKDGLSLTQMIKANIRTSHIPVILLTARGSEEQQIRGMEAMADYYIVKPFKVHFLETVINTLIKNREALREHYSSDCNIDIKQEGPGKLDRRFLNELNAFIDENMDNEALSIEEVCKHIGISRVQLYRKVKALLGCSVNDFILNKRLNKAKSLLTEEDVTISEVSYKVGFSSPSYFSTVFKKRFNVSPKDWKKV